jgi:NAD+ kinase
VAPYRKILFLINHQKAGSRKLADELIVLAHEQGIETGETDAHPLPQGALDGYDLCCTVGGDGTLLGAVREAARTQTPVVGINQGKLGYLTAFSSEEAVHLFPRLLANEYRLETRTLLSVTLSNGQTSVALNDIVIKEKNSAHMIHLAVSCDGLPVTEYRCDGLIFSTPTGSTAYNLSAGGPLIAPDSPVFAMTPICPHTLSNRALILNQEIHLEIQLKNHAQFTIISDGHDVCNDPSAFPIRISRHTQPLLLLQDPHRTTFSIMRQKLNWL